MARANLTGRTAASGARTAGLHRAGPPQLPGLHGGNDHDGDRGPADEPSAQQVLELDGGATLTAPPAAFGDDVTIDATSVGDAPPTPGRLAGLTDPINITAEGQQPRRPLILQVPYDPASVPAGIDPSQMMGVLTDNEGTHTWKPVPVTFDADAAVMTAKLNHLSWKWPWQWDWPGIGAAINQFAGEQVGKRAPAAQCNRGTKVPSWVGMVAVHRRHRGHLHRDLLVPGPGRPSD